MLLFLYQYAFHLIKYILYSFIINNYNKAFNIILILLN